MKAKLFCLMFLLFLAACKKPSIGYNQGYQPKQPIPYDHSLHAGTYKIPCLYCHTNVGKSKHATVPSLNICMNCHKQVKTDSPHIKKIAAAYEAGESIPWVKVHMLPDFVRFDHRPHESFFGSEKEACFKCHGPIDKMKTVYQHSELSMGWCIKCHREENIKAPVNCSTCHY